MGGEVHSTTLFHVNKIHEIMRNSTNLNLQTAFIEKPINDFIPLNFKTLEF